MVRKLKVGLVSGQVDIVGHDEPGARVEIHSVRGKPIRVSIEGDTLEVDHPQLNWENFIDVFKYFRGYAHADVSILVPRDVELKLGVVSASALVSGLKKGAKISTVSGEVVVDSSAGDLELNAASTREKVHAAASKASCVPNLVSGPFEYSRCMRFVAKSLTAMSHPHLLSARESHRPTATQCHHFPTLRCCWRENRGRRKSGNTR